MADRHPSPNPRPIRLTETRKALFQLFGEYFLLGNQDIAALLPGSRKAPLRSAQHLTQELRGRNYLHGELYFDSDNPTTNAEWLYCLTTKGLAYAQERGLCRLGKAANEKSAERLGHDYTLTKFHIQLKQYAEEHGLRIKWLQRDLKRGVHPDALVEIVRGNGKSDWCFVEVEHSKQGKYLAGESALLRKVGKYCEYQRTDACKEDWKYFNSFTVLFLMKNQERADNLLEALAKDYDDGMFWITSRDDPLAFRTPHDHRTVTYSFAATLAPPVSG